MGAEFVVIFISCVMFFCGLVLILGGGDNIGKKFGFVLFMIGLFGIFISIIAYPRDKNYVPADRYNEDYSNDYNYR